MFNDETQEVDNLENIDTEESTEEVVEESAEETQDWESEAKKWKAIAERNKKKADQPKKEEKPEQPKASQSVSVQEEVLRVNGMPEELLTKLKKVADMNQTDLATAQKDETFIALKEKFERDQKREKASVGASKASSGVTPQKDFSNPGLSKEEHKKMWQQAVGR
jgi:hypothetical protein